MKIWIDETRSTAIVTIRSPPRDGSSFHRSTRSTVSCYETGSSGPLSSIASQWLIKNKAKIRTLIIRYRTLAARLWM
jgi:hypothetical protein